MIPPIYLSTNYAFDGFGGKRTFDYARSGNPTRAQLGEALARLERGAGGVVTSSGMAAVDLALSPLKAGAFVIAPHDAYGGTWRLFDARARKGQLEVAFIDQNDEAALDAALAKKPALVWIETPSNPLMRIVDVAAIAKKAKSRRRENCGGQHLPFAAVAKAFWIWARTSWCIPPPNISTAIRT
ncbi:MAG: PLP-dependent transferase [Terricaulis sp.]|nr:PLP-dependent transferase [Terricaulis sp.]